MPTETCRVAVRQHQSVLSERAKHVLEIEIGLDENVRQSNWMRARADTTLYIADRVRHVRVGAFRIVGLAIPAVREVQCSVQIWIIRTGRDVVGKPTERALVPDGCMTDPLGDIVKICRCMWERGSSEIRASDHAKALREFKGLARLSLTNVPTQSGQSLILFESIHAHLCLTDL